MGLRRRRHLHRVPTRATPTPRAGTYTARLTVNDGGAHLHRHGDHHRGQRRPPARASMRRWTSPPSRRPARSTCAARPRTPRTARLPGGALEWQVLLHHATHIHQLSTGTGTDVSFTPLTDHDADSYYEIRLTATDSDGLIGHRHDRGTPPDGAAHARQLARRGADRLRRRRRTRPAPFTKTAAVGFRPTVSAPESFVSGGVTYSFSHWSDGGARQHAISVPASDSTLTATYAPEDCRPVRVHARRGHLGGREHAHHQLRLLQPPAGGHHSDEPRLHALQDRRPRRPPRACR